MQDYNGPCGVHSCARAAISIMEIGHVNSLQVIKQVDFGVFLDGGGGVEILMPRRYVPKGVEIGQAIDAFIYRDSEDRLIATTLRPKIMVGQCACLEVRSVTRIGAFLDWGLPKDLLLPYNQMANPLKEGDTVVVYAYVDERTDRIAASSRLSLFLKEQGTGLKVGQQVELMIVSRSDLGVKAVINGSHLGLIFHADLTHKVEQGDILPGFIKRIRAEDQRIDLALDASRAPTRKDLHSEIMSYLKQQGGEMDITDKSSPERIVKVFGVSKGAFKKALGALYKDRKILIEKDRVSLAASKEQVRQKKNKKKKHIEK